MAEATEFVVVERGRPAAVVLGERASPTERHAGRPRELLLTG